MLGDPDGSYSGAAPSGQSCIASHATLPGCQELQKPGAGPEGPAPPADAAVCQTVMVSDTEVRTELPLKVTLTRVPFEMPFSFAANVPFLLSLALVRFFP